MPYNGRQVREYAGGSIGGILRKGGSGSASATSSITTGSSVAYCGEAKQIDLLVFGYACKVFRDDDKAREIDQGKQLIPWMGDISLKIDRYDVRGALYDLTPYEAPPGGYGNRLDYLTAEEQRAEQLCEEERYLYLYNNEEQQILHQEEELKRFKQESGGYNQVGLQYVGGDVTNSNDIPHGPNREEFSNSPTCEESDQAFTLPKNFVVPPSIQLPETMKQHAVIEKTARFIASQGVQMEILLKAKQSNNLQFEFLTQNSLLNPYYKFVLNAIKDKTYPAKETITESKPDETSKYEERQQLEDAALATRPVITVPTIKYKPSANCAYTQLISKIKGVPMPEFIDEHTSASEAAERAAFATAEDNADNFTPVLLQYNGQTYVTAESAKETTNSNLKSQDATINSPPKVEILKNSSALLLAQNYSSGSESESEEEKPPSKPEPKLSFPIPTDNLKNIIDKTASYVIKNGRQFEETLRAKSEDRFTFLLPENEFYPYYMYKITGDPDAASIEQKTRKAVAVAAALMSKKRLLPMTDKNGSAHVSFSIKAKDDQLQPALPQEPSDDDEENAQKPTNSSDTQLRNVPEHVKKAIQLVESQLMARNAQMAAVVGSAASTVPLPCNIGPSLRSRFDVDYNGQITKPTTALAAITSAELERNAIFEQQQQNRHKELKRAEEKVKDKLAQIAREKLGGLITKEKQLQLERKRKAMAFLNQIKGSSENELSPDKKLPAKDGNASDCSEESVHSIPITSYGPDDKTDDEEAPPAPRISKLPSPKPFSPVIKITAAVTLSDDDDDVTLVSETKAPPITVVHKRKSLHVPQRRSRSPSRFRETNKRLKNHAVPRQSSEESCERLAKPAHATKSHSHKSVKTKKSSSKSHSKKKSKKRSRSRSHSRSLSRPSSKSHRSSRSHSTYRVTHTSYNHSASEESDPSPVIHQRRHQHSKRSKREQTPTRKEKRRKH